MIFFFFSLQMLVVWCLGLQAHSLQPSKQLRVARYAGQSVINISVTAEDIFVGNCHLFYDTLRNLIQESAGMNNKFWRNLLNLIETIPIVGINGIVDNISHIYMLLSRKKSIKFS
jgi:hypothetical protein